MSVSQVLLLLSGVALFLFGMTLMGDGLKKASGSKLEPILYRLSDTPLKGIMLGTGVTAVIQSSCATSVMAVGFVNAGMMKLRQAIGVILGAILGTSITGWIICLSYIDGGSGIGSILSTRTLTGIVAVIGVYLRLFSRKPAHQYVGDVLMGFAILMLGMSTMSGAVSDLGKQAWFTAVMTSMTMLIPGILVGTLFTAILQSASAALGIIQALSVTGAMTYGSSIPLLMGVAIGASFPVLLSAVGASADGKRTAMVYLVSSVLGTAVIALVYFCVKSLVPLPFLEEAANPFSLAAVNTIYRLAMLLLLAPFTNALEKLVERLVPDDAKKQDTLQLEERFLEHPALAVEQVRISMEAMADMTREALEKAVSLLESYADDGFERVRQLEEDCDRYEDLQGSYLVRLTSRELTEQQNREVLKYLHVLTDFERISDHARNIAESAKEMHDKHLAFSDEASREISVAVSAVIEVVHLSMDAFAEDDLQKAERVEPLEEVIDDLCDAITRNHVERLQQGKCTILNGFVLNDLVTDLERISDHCSNIAAAMIELGRGAYDTHNYVDGLLRRRSAEFESAYREYRARFDLPTPNRGGTSGAIPDSGV